MTVGELKFILSDISDEMEIQFDSIDEPIEDPVFIISVESRCDDIERLYIGVYDES